MEKLRVVSNPRPAPTIARRIHPMRLGQLIRFYRERSAVRLTQRTLAAWVGVSEKTVRNWENEISVPRSGHLQHLIEVCLQHGLFTPDHAEAEARELWRMQQDADGHNTLPDFDAVWVRLRQSAQTPLPGALPRTSPPHRYSLPPLRQPTIGRDTEHQALLSMLRAGTDRLITVVGGAGIGKTHLALSVGHVAEADFTHGALFVDLAGVSDPALVMETIAQYLGLPERGAQTARHSLQTALKGLRLLLILDNIEHITPATPDIVALIAAAPGLAVVVTSRVVLPTHAALVYSVKPLELPPASRFDPALLPPSDVVCSSERAAAVRMFVERAQQHTPGFRVTPENAVALAGICRILDGVPLALELAAARLQMFAPNALLRRLEGAGGSSPLHVLSVGLRDILAWSYTLLDPAEQRIFRRISIFRGGAPLVACEALCADPPGTPGGNGTHTILPILMQLTDKSLLSSVVGDDGEPRFAMLEIVRDFAATLLTESDEAERVAAVHTSYFLSLVETGVIGLRGGEQMMWAVRLEREHANVRAVLQRALAEEQPAPALRMSAALWPFWDLHGCYREGRYWLEAALTLDRTKGEAAEYGVTRAKVWHGLGMIALYQGDFAMGRDYVESALDLLRKLDPTQAAAPLNSLGIALTQHADYDTAAVSLNEALALWRASAERDGESQALNNLGMLETQRGAYETAAAYFDRAHTLYRERDNRHGLAKLYNNMGEWAVRQEKWTEAEVYLSQSLVIHLELSDKRGVAGALTHLAQVAYEKQDWARFALLQGAVARINGAAGLTVLPDRSAALAAAQEQGREALGPVYDSTWAAGYSQDWRLATRFLNPNTDLLDTVTEARARFGCEMGTAPMVLARS